MKKRYYVNRTKMLLLLVFLIAAMSLLPACINQEQKNTNNILIKFQRSGGIAGLDDELIIHKDGEISLKRDNKVYNFTLEPDTTRHIQNLISEVDFTKLKTEYIPEHRGYDFFTYVISYKGFMVRVIDTAVPDSLIPLIESLNQIIQKYQR